MRQAGADAESGSNGMTTLVGNPHHQLSSMHPMQGMAMSPGMTQGMMPSQCMPSQCLPDGGTTQMSMQASMPMGGMGMRNVGMACQMSSQQSSAGWNRCVNGVMSGGMGGVMNGQMSFMSSQRPQQRLVGHTAGNDTPMMGCMMPSQMPNGSGMASNGIVMRPSTVGSFAGSANGVVMPSQQMPHMATAMVTMMPMRPWM